MLAESQARALLLALTSLRRRLLISIGSLPVSRSRVLGWSLAVLVHVALAYLVLFGLPRPPTPIPAKEIQMTLIGGARVILSKPIEPRLVPPDTPLVLPPEIVADVTPSDAITVAPAPGGPGVTVPAEAIGETHIAPALSADFLALARKSILRLLLHVAEDGRVTEAAVQTSTGSAELDRLVVGWVQQHWRYRPALRNGTPVAVTTTAIVPF